jgi:hypothetical protein
MNPRSQLFIQIRPSKIFAMILILLHSGAGIVLWLLALPLPAKLGIFGLIIVSLLHSIHYHLLLNHYPLKDCSLYYDGILLNENQKDELITQIMPLLYVKAILKYACFLKWPVFIATVKCPKLTAKIASDSYFSTQLVILRVSIHFTSYLDSSSCWCHWRKSPLILHLRRTYSLVLFSDAFSDENAIVFRILRIRLRHPYELKDPYKP